MSSIGPIELNYLVFDDDNEEINQNMLNVQVPGYKFNPVFINPVDFYVVADNTFDLNSFKEKIWEDTKGLQISMIATDWNMLARTSNYSEVNGLTIIEILVDINEKYRKCPFLIYSGKSDEASQVLLGKIQDEISNGNNAPISSLELLSLLLELKIKFCARNSRFEEIKTMVRGQKTISLIVLDMLTRFERNFVVNTGNEYYDGKTLGTLVDLISQNNELGLRFIREFIELSIANYTEINAS